MARSQSEQTINELLGSAHIFSSTVDEVVEKRLLEEMTGRALTPSQFKLLRMVSLTDAQTIGDVARFLRVSKAAASKAVDKLVRRKLLRREEGRPDRREIRLSLTAASRRHVAAYEQRKRRRLAQIFGELPEDDLRRATEVLDRLSAGLVDHSARPESICLQCGIYFRNHCLVRRLTKRRCFYLHHSSGRKARSDRVAKRRER